MTVQGEATAASGPVDRDTADQRFTAIYDEYWARLNRFVWMRMDLWQKQTAEDLTQEVFIEFWRLFVLKGRDLDRPYGLLCAIAVRKVNYFRSLQKNGERVKDLGDPVNTPIVANGHAYAPAVPGLAELSDQLDQAMESMSEKSEAWRTLHKEAHRHRKILSDNYRPAYGGATLTSKERAEKNLAVVEEKQQKALEQFRNACRTVGQLRAELESRGGANWKSAGGMPASAGRSNVRDGSMSDPTTTHCPSGHQLTLPNTFFYADGARRCQVCMDEAGRKNDAKRAQKAGKPKRGNVVGSAQIDAAREMAGDPNFATVSLRKIAEMNGMSEARLYSRIPDLRELRQQARAQALAGATR